MGHVVTLDLPGEMAQRAEAVAARTHRSVEEVLLEWLSRGATDAPVAQLSDDEVLVLADTQMDEHAQREMSELLARQREGALDAEERRRLEELLALYRQGMVRKAQALQVAVERGLRPPLDVPESPNVHG
jgi:hypothetical protein